VQQILSLFVLLCTSLDLPCDFFVGSCCCSSPPEKALTGVAQSRMTRAYLQAGFVCTTGSFFPSPCGRKRLSRLHPDISGTHLWGAGGLKVFCFTAGMGFSFFLFTIPLLLRPNPTLCGLCPETKQFALLCDSFPPFSYWSLFLPHSFCFSEIWPGSGDGFFVVFLSRLFLVPSVLSRLFPVFS